MCSLEDNYYKKEGKETADHCDGLKMRGKEGKKTAITQLPEDI